MKSNPYIIKRKSSIHGYGIFAKRFIPKETRVVEYIGEKITKAEAERRGPKLVEYAKSHKEHGAVYLFELNKKYDIDGHVHYNTAKYINHSCDPNCEVQIIRGHIWIIALRNINESEELFYNYGYDDLQEYHEHPCYCGADRCVGFILSEDHWPKLKELVKTANKLR